ncbi:hypothetical protein GCM10010358_57400 [Streptomyces minutiscleroticus]|uniref:Uncharacterized protein n=1 Tax=Streptomyces minutiscleroticus TaxID=68238 RepID=A0A918U630_9ACTN|nr:hypothetical protein GCM10010358_57400 [Streptomyces minutiscleroticus]
MIGRLCGMTTHRSPKPAASVGTADRAVTAALVLALLAALGWLGGMICTVLGWSM